ncbi:MAG: GntR family transcriptional regulator [Chitinophagales bacterium]|nr:GntR family transcriptional regulator [Chitinophagales bacterium]
MSSGNESLAQQVIHWVCRKVLTEEWKPGDAMDERQISAQLEMNPNLIHTAFDALLKNGLAVHQSSRLLVADNAKAAAQELLRKHFFEYELPVLQDKLKLLNISLQDLSKS